MVKIKTPALIAEARRLYDEEGWQFTAIAERLGVHPKTVRNWYGRRTVQPRGAGAYWSDPEVQARSAARRAEGEDLARLTDQAARLYDIRDMDITARVMGDPPPGRSSLASRGDIR